VSAAVLRGNVFDVLPTIGKGSVDCVCTSPPYWMLRSYLPKDHPLKHLELGSETTPQEYVENQVKVFRLVRDALADHGTVFLNVGDSYSSNSNTGRKDGGRPKTLVPRGVNGALVPSGQNAPQTAENVNRVPDGISEGNLCLIPQRLAIALQADGWVVRSVVVWHKPAPMPASLAGWRWTRCRVKVKAADVSHGQYASGDRETMRKADGSVATHRDVSSFSSTEQLAQWADCPGCKKCEPHGGYVLRKGSWRPTSSWEPVLMLAKKPGYFCDGFGVQTPAASATVNRNQYTRVIDDPDEQYAVAHDHETTHSTANLRDVWTIAAEPLREKHYAAFPSELVYRCLKAGTSASGYCPACGLPWCRVVESTPMGCDHSAREAEYRAAGGNGRTALSGTMTSPPRTDTLGWRPSCPCPPHEPRAGRVLDPFAGSGRTGVEALRLGLDFVGCELNPEYADMAERILVAESPLFATATG
jgi:DNA modification methylase